MNEETIGLKLVAQDMASGVLSKVRGELTKMGGVSGIAGKGLGLAERAMGGLGSAASHLKGTIGGLVSGPLGFLGLTAGALGLFGALKSGIDTASNMALSLEKLTNLTGESAQAMSGLLAVTGKFNITSDQLSTIVGFEEKTTGKLAQTYVKTAHAGKSAALQALELKKAREQEAGASTKVIDKLITEQKARDAVNASMAKSLPPINKLQALEKQYGVTLTDNKGHALDYSQVLNNVSDYYRSNATAGQKAALASTIFGRGYSVLIPVLQLGAKGFAEAQQAAESLGLTIKDQSQLGTLMKYQENMRELGDAVGGLQLQLSLALLPALNDVASTLTQFVGTHRDQIVGFFQGMVQWSRQAAGVVTGELIPGLQGLAKTASDAWNAIPPELRTMIVTALVADRTMKFLFGFDPVTTVGKLIGGQILGVLASGLGLVASKAVGNTALSAITQRGSSPANPMWVQMVGGAGGGPGGLTPVVEDSESALTKVLKFLPWVGIAAALATDPKLNYSSSQSGTGQDLNKIDTAVRGNEIGSAAGYGTRTLPGGMPGTMGAGSAMSRAWANIGPLVTSINKLAIAEQQRLNAHAAARKAVGGHGDPFHQFLLQLRSGSAAMAVKLGAKELAYLSTTSAGQRDSAVTQRGIREDISAEKRALVNASGDQKRVISANIKGLEALLKDQKPPVVNVNVGITAKSVDRVKTSVKTYGPQNRDN